MSVRILFILFPFLFMENIYTQIISQIQILDSDTKLPVSGIAYQYGPKTDVSDEEGLIVFSFIEHQKMLLSHISYGTWEWNDEEIKKIIEAKIFLRKRQFIDLYPVTIIGVQNKTEPDERLDMDFADKMVHDGAALLTQIPSFSSIQKSRNYGNDPVFRGYKYDQLNIVLDGAQSATAACPNRMDPPTSQMSPNMIDHIQVYKGPHALRFGTGLGGTVNFIPFKLRFGENPFFYGRFSGGYENNGNNIQSEGLLGVSRENYNLNFLAAWSQADDYRDGNDGTVQGDFTRGSFGVNLGWKIASNQQFRATANYNIARDADFPALPMDLRQDDTWLFNLRHDYQVYNRKLSSWNTTLFGSYVDHKMDNLLKPLNPRIMNATTEAQTSNYGGRTEGVWKSQSSKYYLGADFRVSGAEGTRVRSFLAGPNAGKVIHDNAWQNGHISTSAVFAEMQLQITQLHFTISTRLEYNKARITNPSPEFIQEYPDTEIRQINPSLSLGLKNQFNEHMSSGLWIGRGQRSAGLAERYINYFPIGQDPYEMLGNPQLKPEINNQADVTFLFTWEKTNLNIDFFMAYLQNYISSFIDPSLETLLPNSPGVRRFENIDDAFKTGFEARWRQRWHSHFWHELSVAYTYAQDLEQNQPLPEIAPMDVRIVLHGKLLQEKLKPELVFRQVLQQSRISTEFGETNTPSFSLLDFQMKYEFSEKMKVHLGVTNLFDILYYEHLSRSVRGAGDPLYAPGRNYFSKISIQF